MGDRPITQLFNKIYDTGYIPSDLGIFTFVPVPKKLKALKCSDFRTICLMSYVTKALMKVILERNKAKINWEINYTQSRFRRGMVTREGIFNLRTINEIPRKAQRCSYLLYRL